MGPCLYHSFTQCFVDSELEKEKLFMHMKTSFYFKHALKTNCAAHVFFPIV